MPTLNDYEWERLLQLAADGAAIISRTDPAVNQQDGDIVRRAYEWRASQTPGRGFPRIQERLPGQRVYVTSIELNFGEEQPLAPGWRLVQVLGHQRTPTGEISMLVVMASEEA